VVPEPRFLFNEYKVDTLNDKSILKDESSVETKRSPSESEGNSNYDYFSFFQSHDRVIFKPESSFVNIRKFV